MKGFGGIKSDGKAETLLFVKSKLQTYFKKMSDKMMQRRARDLGDVHCESDLLFEEVNFKKVHPLTGEILESI